MPSDTVNLKLDNSACSCVTWNKLSDPPEVCSFIWRWGEQYYLFHRITEEGMKLMKAKNLAEWPTNKECEVMSVVTDHDGGGGWLLTKVLCPPLLVTPPHKSMLSIPSPPTFQSFAPTNISSFSLLHPTASEHTTWSTLTQIRQQETFLNSVSPLSFFSISEPKLLIDSEFP